VSLQTSIALTIKIYLFIFIHSGKKNTNPIISVNTAGDRVKKP